MNEKDIRLLWQYADKLSLPDVSLRKDAISRRKVRHVLFSMKPLKLFALFAGIVWVLGLGGLIVWIMANHLSRISLFFLISAITQWLITAVSVGIYTYQILLIQHIDFSEPVLAIQEKVSRLKLSTLTVTRLLILQLPVWTTFYWNEKMFTIDYWKLWILQGIVTLLFTYIATWLFVHIKYENRNKRWFRWIFRGQEWEPLHQSMELLNQLEHYQAEEKSNL